MQINHPASLGLYFLETDNEQVHQKFRHSRQWVDSHLNQGQWIMPILLAHRAQKQKLRPALATE